MAKQKDPEFKPGAIRLSAEPVTTASKIEMGPNDFSSSRLKLLPAHHAGNPGRKPRDKHIHNTTANQGQNIHRK
jgi:hypothetical protein